MPSKSSARPSLQWKLGLSLLSKIWIALGFWWTTWSTMISSILTDIDLCSREEDALRLGIEEIKAKTGELYEGN
jgi:hypothetical protein